MTKPIPDSASEKPVPDLPPKAPEAAQGDAGREKRRPSKSRQIAWAKIDAGKGTWKPR